MPSEMILFHKGLSSSARSALQEPGTLKTAVNISFAKEGEQTLRPKFSNINTTATNAIKSVYRFRNIIVFAASKSLYYIGKDGGAPVTLGSSFSNARWRFKEYKDFLHGVNGYEEVLIDENGNCYPAQIENPATAPTLADSGAGSGPNGIYDGYVSFFITFPNGMTYETGLSEGSADLTIADNEISWTDIAVSTYEAYYGTEPTIYRKLYRGPGTGGTLTDIYYVDTVEDNTTTTYTDSETDSDLAANGASVVDDYDYLPHSYFIEYHYGRAFGIDKAKQNRLMFTEAVSSEDADENEALMPIAHDTLADWDDIRVAGFTKVDVQGLISWGTNIYIPLKQTWLRKQGNDPSTWTYKKTWAQYGVGAPDTISLSAQPSGIISLSAPDGGEPCLTLFNGQIAESFSNPKLDYVLNNDLNHIFIDNCRGFCAGKYYHLLYPSHDSEDGTPDKWLAIDLRRFPDIRCSHWEGLNAVCGFSYDQENAVYIGTTNGYVKKIDSTSWETIDVEIETEDRIGGEISLANISKTLKELKYNLIGTATLGIIIDGVTMTWQDGTTSKTITGTKDEVQVLRSLPQNFHGYVYRLKITATDVTSFTIFSPWQIDFDVK